MKLYIGTSGWNYECSQERLCAYGVKQSEWLGHRIMEAIIKGTR